MFSVKTVHLKYTPDSRKTTQIKLYPRGAQICMLTPLSEKYRLVLTAYHNRTN